VRREHKALFFLFYMSYKIECPVCFHKAFAVTPEKGFSYCFACSYMEQEGNKKQTPKQKSKHIPEIRDLYTRITEYYHSSLDKKSIDYLHSRGISDTSIQQFKLGYCPIGKSPFYKGILARESGLATYEETAVLGDRIVFPYFINDTLVTDIRGRSFDNELRYKSPYNTSYYRGAIYPYNYKTYMQANKVIITEGEIKAIIAEQYGHATISIPGVLSWRSGFRENEGKEHILLFDSQTTHTRQLHDAIQKIAQKIDRLKIATLPLFGKDKQDIDSFILTYGIDAFNIIIDKALEYNIWNTLQR